MRPRKNNPTSAIMREEKMKRIAAIARAGLTSAEKLAAEIGCNERTIYRYIARMRAKGIPIRGEAGYGYRIFTPEEERARQMEKEERARERGPKTFGQELTDFILARHPNVMSADPKDSGIVMGSLSAIVGGILAGVMQHHGEVTMIETVKRFNRMIAANVEDISQKAILMATDKPAGAQGEN